MLTKLPILLGVLLSTQAFAKEVICKGINIHSEERKEQFIKITPISPKIAKFEICQYKSKECKNILGGYYRVDNLLNKARTEDLKGSFKLITEGEVALSIGVATGAVAYLPLMGGTAFSAAGTELLALLGIQSARVVWSLIMEETVAVVSTSVAGAASFSTMGALVGTKNFLNPLNNFRNQAAMKEINSSLKENSCAMFVDDSEEDLLYRMESVVEKLDFIPQTKTSECEEET